ncbi:MAG: tetrahydrofolate dehydrogenase/cyclohydrolase catalytic domain-containing protein [Minisyncoccota bacterium]
MIVDGRVLAQEVLARAKARADASGKTPHVIAIVANETSATKSYLRIKEKRAAEAGCVLEVTRLAEDSSTAELVAAVLSASATADVVIVQLPLASSVDTKAVLDAIPVSKDADVLSSSAREHFEKMGMLNIPKLLPPVVGAVREIFERNSIEVEGKTIVVIGDGFLVGSPIATWLKQQGAEVRVLTIETTPEEMSAALRAADIVVSGAGSPHHNNPDMIKLGVVLIDAGTSELGGEVVGDADPACADRCSIFTPVPGGVGPLAVACLFENVVALACPHERSEETTIA